jgi:glycosyltransferase involved in cell wall biosynthesis
LVMIFCTANMMQSKAYFSSANLIHILYFCSFHQEFLTMPNELVSVIMCTYNGALYVTEQLDSILAQGYSPLEIIVADDASTDETWTILQSYAAKDQRIKIFRNEKNVGFNINFSQACEKATGKFIAIADQDDIWEPEKIAVLVDAIKESKDTMLVHCISARFEEKGKPHLRSLRLLNYFNGNDVRYFMLSNYVSGHNMLLRKELLAASLPFPPNMYYDWWLVVNACVIGQVKAVEKILVWHRMHQQNATGAAKPKVPFYQQVKVVLSSILSIPNLTQQHRRLAEELYHRYQVLPEKKFSASLFWFLFTHARHLLAYKKRTFPWISYLKYSLKYARRSTNA